MGALRRLLRGIPEISSCEGKMVQIFWRCYQNPGRWRRISIRSKPGRVACKGPIPYIKFRVVIMFLGDYRAAVEYWRVYTLRSCE